MFFGGFPGFGNVGDHDGSGAVNNQEFYRILGVEETASQDEVKTAYRKKVIKAHPDKGGDPGEFNKLQTAYEVISNPKKREIYDKYGLDGFINDDDNEGVSGMDLFESMLGGLFGRGRGQSEERKMQPLVQEVNITLEDAYLGGTKKVIFKTERDCEGCDGKGGKDTKKCDTCKGTGEVEKMVQLTPDFIAQARIHCSNCQGEGTVYEAVNRCQVCEGEKVKKEEKTLEVSIEQGIPHGALISFSGEDHKSGLIAKINIAHHKQFERKGADLYMTKKISLYEALTGVTFYVDHLDGKKILVVSSDDEVIAPGTQKQIGGKGMPFYKDVRSHGNLYVTFDIEFPRRKEILSIETLKSILPVPTDLLVVTNEQKKKAEVLDEFDKDSVNARAEGGREGRRQSHDHGRGGDDDDGQSSEQKGGSDKERNF